jgi:hypothetical protein
MSDDDPVIRTNCELHTSILLKLSIWQHEPCLLSFVGHLLSRSPTQFVRLRPDNRIVVKQRSGDWNEIGHFSEVAQHVRRLSTKIRLDADEYGVLLGRLASLRWRR